MTGINVYLSVCVMLGVCTFYTALVNLLSIQIEIQFSEFFSTGRDKSSRLDGHATDICHVWFFHYCSR